MLGKQLIIYSVVAAVSLSAANISVAADEEWSFSRDFSKGRWRTEITTTTGAINNHWPRHDEDYFLLGTVEYEWPIHSNVSYSLRGSPLFLFNRHGADDCDSSHIYGAAFGTAFRLYEKKELNGLFAEIGTSAMWHSDYLPGSGSKFNFISDIGIGYAFKNRVSVAVKYFHISNAGLARINSGFDAFGVSLAYVF